MHDYGMKNTDNVSIPIRVCIIVGQDHDITMSAWVERVLGTLRIVHGVIYM